MDYSMEIDHQTTRKRCRDDDSADDFAQVLPTAKKTRQFHFPSATDAFASAFALAQAHPFANTNNSLSLESSSSPSSAASSPNLSGQSSPGGELMEDPFRAAAMAVDSWSQAQGGSGQLSEMQLDQPELQQQQQQQPPPQHQSQPTLHPPPGRRGMIISGWNQARRNDNMSGVVQCWPQR